MVTRRVAFADPYSVVPVKQGPLTMSPTLSCNNECEKHCGDTTSAASHCNAAQPSVMLQRSTDALACFQGLHGGVKAVDRCRAVCRTREYLRHIKNSRLERLSNENWRVQCLNYQLTRHSLSWRHNYTIHGTVHSLCRLLDLKNRRYTCLWTSS